MQIVDNLGQGCAIGYGLTHHFGGEAEALGRVRVAGSIPAGIGGQTGQVERLGGRAEEKGVRLGLDDLGGLGLEKDRRAPTSYVEQPGPQWCETEGKIGGRWSAVGRVDFWVLRVCRKDVWPIFVRGGKRRESLCLWGMCWV